MNGNHHHNTTFNLHLSDFLVAVSWICTFLNAIAMGFRLSIEPRPAAATLDFLLALGYVLPYIFGHMGVFILWYSMFNSLGKKRVLFSYIFGFLLIAFEIIMALGYVSINTLYFSLSKAKNFCGSLLVHPLQRSFHWCSWVWNYRNNVS